MNPNKRKTVLLVGLGLIMVFYSGDWLMTNAVDRPLSLRRRKLESLQKIAEKKDEELAHARKATQELAVWQSKSLPSDSEVARSLYQAWLLELVNYVELSSPHVDSGTPMSRRGLFQTISFTVRGRGTLNQLTTFLFEFYSANYLHQIRSLSITPISRSDTLDLSFSIETIVLKDTGRPDRLPSGRSDRLASYNLADYRVIAARNLFGIGGTPDATDYTYLTTVVYVDDQPEAWFTLRATDEVRRHRVGDTLQVGQFQGTVAEIVDGDVILESDGERWLLTIGENLAGAFALPPEL